MQKIKILPHFEKLRKIPLRVEAGLESY